MDIELLRTFLEVNRTRHFGEAADALHLTQAAVSSRIKLLEETIGAQLFDRSKREIRLTPEGHRLIRYADILISVWRKARQDVTAGEAKQQISLAGSLRLWNVLLRPWFHQLRRSMPDLAITVESHTPELLIRRVLDGVIDVAFMLEPAQLETLSIVEVAQLQLVLVSSEPGLTPEEAVNGNYIMVDWGLAHSVEHRRVFPDAVEPHIRVSQAQMAIDHILALGGNAYLPRHVLDEQLSSGMFHIVAGSHVFRRHVYAVYPLRSPKNELVNEILKLFQLVI